MRPSITGSGTIDGRGGEVVNDLLRLLKEGVLRDGQWPVKMPGEANRPHVLLFEECSRVTVKGVTIKNGAGWVQNYTRCNGVSIDSMTVESLSYWNNDGIDVVNSKNVSITHCTINSADDAICLKPEGSVPALA